MDTPVRVQYNTKRNSNQLDPKDLFWEMAYDLKVWTSPKVINAYSLLMNGKYLKFVDTLAAMSQQMYETPGDSIHREQQLASLFVKFPFNDPSINRKKTAIKRFQKSEHRCRRMNQKFRARRYRKEPAHMQYMRDYILRVIGSKPNYSYIYSHCDFGPGSSVGVHGADTHVLNKLDYLSCTPSCVPVALAALGHNTHYLSYLADGECYSLDAGLHYPSRNKPNGVVEIMQVPYNKITCVPKNAKTDRTIAIEPTLNSFVQKGIDLCLRQRLKRIGCDLSDQSWNQHLARLGSRDDSYATIDLSSASDSVSIELVRELLPPEWFSLLNATRTPSYVLDGKTPVRYEKFCSMGNGFCFPLETLIFRAAAEYAMSQTLITHKHNMCAVYGDDIIVPRECALLLIEVLSDLGFKTNEDKTFIFGPFRESCGADYFLGENVRPIFVKEALRLNHKIYPLMNSLRRRGFLSTWQKLLNLLPKRFHHFRPYEREDDTAITVPLDTFMASESAIWNRDHHAWEWMGVVPRNHRGREPANDVEVLLGKLRGDLVVAELFSSRFNEATRLQLFS